MRQFRLINGLGKEINLTTKDIFFHDISGLGFENEIGYRSLGNRFSIVSNKPRQIDIEGNIAFLSKDPYTQYYEFINNISVGSLTIIYNTDGITDYYKEVVVSSISKTELTREGYLDVPIKFTPCTPWYKFVQVATVPESSSQNKGWIWGQSPWSINMRSINEMSLSIDSTSHIDSPCKLIIEGPIKNPSWTHYANGQEISTGKVKVVVPEDHILVVNNISDPYEISVKDKYENEIQNAYQLSNFATQRFIYLKHGRNVIRVSSEDLNNVPIRMEARLYYESV